MCGVRGVRECCTACVQAMIVANRSAILERRQERDARLMALAAARASRARDRTAVGDLPVEGTAGGLLSSFDEGTHESIVTVLPTVRMKTTTVRMRVTEYARAPRARAGRKGATSAKAVTWQISVPAYIMPTQAPASLVRSVPWRWQEIKENKWTPDQTHLS